MQNGFNKYCKGRRNDFFQIFPFIFSDNRCASDSAWSHYVLDHNHRNSLFIPIGFLRCRRNASFSEDPGNVFTVTHYWYISGSADIFAFMLQMKDMFLDVALPLEVSVLEEFIRL